MLNKMFPSSTPSSLFLLPSETTKQGLCLSQIYLIS